jgi:hypothetical protein
MERAEGVAGAARASRPAGEDGADGSAAALRRPGPPVCTRERPAELLAILEHAIAKRLTELRRVRP